MTYITDHTTRMTRTDFKDKSIQELKSLGRPISITHTGKVEWVVLEKDQYDKLMDKLTELVTAL